LSSIPNEPRIGSGVDDHDFEIAHSIRIDLRAANENPKDKYSLRYLWGRGKRRLTRKDQQRKKVDFVFLRPENCLAMLIQNQTTWLD
jgi:hypothetical protein